MLWVMTLSVANPTLYAIIISPNALVTDVWNSDEGGGCWNPSFSRPFNDWEMEDANDFLCCQSWAKVQPSERIRQFGWKRKVDNSPLSPY